MIDNIRLAFVSAAPRRTPTIAWYIANRGNVTQLPIRKIRAFSSTWASACPNSNCKIGPEK